METNDLQAGGGEPGPGEPGPGETGGATSAAAIVAAAERLAAEITRNAQAEADAIRARAGSDSEAARSVIDERVQRLSVLAAGISERLREMRAELDALSASLDGPPAAGVRSPEDGPPAVVVPAPGAVQPVAAVPDADAAPASAGAAESPAAAGIDDAGARLIALNLALSDTPRDEAARQLRDQVPDPERLVDEVYASVDR